MSQKKTLDDAYEALSVGDYSLQTLEIPAETGPAIEAAFEDLHISPAPGEDDGRGQAGRSGAENAYR